MSVQSTKAPKANAAPQPEPPEDANNDEAHVPEWAENMEHTLRRLAKEKQEKRDKQPGLYL